MIPFENAYKIVMETCLPLETETTNLHNLFGRILSEDIQSKFDSPPFDKSLMDGYACREEDIKNILTVIEHIPAGYIPQKKIGKNECVKIMTGAMIPEGANVVFIVEETEVISNTEVKFTGEMTNRYIRKKGDNLKKGDVVLKKGTRIKAQQVGTITSLGYESVSVYKKPVVGIIATGDELIEPSQEMHPGKIYNSNSYQLASQITNMGASPKSYGIAKDTVESLDAIIKKARSECDVLLLSAGVSMGDFDLVPKVLIQNGFELLFQKVAIKPGKPTVFGKSEKQYCFGLPGNPVSTFVICEMLVKPFLYKMMGHDFKVMPVKKCLKEDYTRRNASRKSWVPVMFDGEDGVTQVFYNDSGHLNALALADALFAVERDVKKIEKGTLVEVYPI